jgi:hypothetical protein
VTLASNGAICSCVNRRSDRELKSMSFKPSKTLASLSLALLFLAGCSDSKIKTVPVSGRISIAGQSLPKECYVYFVPTQPAEGMPSRPSVATVAEDGSYQVKAFKDSRGLVPGTYNVLVAYTVLKPGGNPNLDSSWIERRYEAGELVVEADSDDIEHNIEVPAATGGKAKA